MSLINISNLTFSYDGSYDTIFDKVSFQIDSDWKLGFVGRNGKGKTTFLKLLQGQYPYSGTIGSSVTFEYFPYPVEDSGQTTLEIMETIHPYFEHWQLSRELNLLSVDEEVLTRPFCTLSHGEQTKVLLAILFLKENQFLLIDEPTNHLDSHARALVSHYLNSKKGFILVSHDRNFLDDCTDHILSINKNTIEVQQGNFSSWYENKNAQDHFELMESEKLKGEIKRLEEASRRASNWSEKLEKTKKGTRIAGLRPDTGYIGHQSAKMMKRAKSSERRQQVAIEEKSKLLKNTDTAEDLKLFPLSYRNNPLVSMESLSIFYGDKEVCKSLNFSIEKGDRISISGKNGCGKSSLLKLILGDALTYTGSIHRGSQLKISYVSQDTSHLKGTLQDFIAFHGLEESLFKALLRKLDFQRIQFEKPMETYSGGQKKKVLLAASLCQKAHLYIWDEPLNYIDLLSRIQIEKLILAYQPTLLFVEHDTLFKERIATKTILL